MRKGRFLGLWLAAGLVALAAPQVDAMRREGVLKAIEGYSAGGFAGVLSAITNPGGAPTNGTPAQAPVVVGPPKDVVIDADGVTLEWYFPMKVSQYQLVIIPANGDGPSLDLIRNTETSFRVNSPRMGEGNYFLLPDMGYIWGIRGTAWDNAVDETSPVWGEWVGGSFRTPPTSSATITPVSPQPGAAVSSRTPVLTWANDDIHVFYYELQVSKDPNFGPNVFLYSELVHGGASDPLNSYHVPAQFPLEAGATYYWHVRPRVQGDGRPVPWTPNFSFTTP